MAFEFRLDPVLRHRRRLEETAAQRLADTEREMAARRARVVALVEDVRLHSALLADGAERGDTGAALAALGAGLEALHARVANAVAGVEAQQGEVDAARAQVVEATRARRALERLLETARAEHARHIERLEQRQSDDLAAAGLLWREAQAPAHESPAAGPVAR